MGAICTVVGASLPVFFGLHGRRPIKRPVASVTTKCSAILPFIFIFLPFLLFNSYQFEWLIGAAEIGHGDEVGEPSHKEVQTRFRNLKPHRGKDTKAITPQGNGTGLNYMDTVILCMRTVNPIFNLNPRRRIMLS